MTSLEKAKKIVKILDDKKGDDIKTLKVENLTVITDYFIVVTATSSTHVKALADEVEFKMKQEGVNPYSIEGYNSAQWVLLDYGDVIVHVFYPEARGFYDLERLWADAAEVDLLAE